MVDASQLHVGYSCFVLTPMWSLAGGMFSLHATKLAFAICERFCILARKMR
jgi:hypothetical protein